MIVPGRLDLPGARVGGLPAFDAAFKVLGGDQRKVGYFEVGVEEGGELAVATEEQAVRMIYAGENPVINYDGPSLTNTWRIDSLRNAA